MKNSPMTTTSHCLTQLRDRYCFTFPGFKMNETLPAFHIWKIYSNLFLSFGGINAMGSLKVNDLLNFLWKDTVLHISHRIY